MSLDEALEAALRYVDEMASEQPELAPFVEEAKRGLVEAAALAREKLASADDDEV